MDAKTRSPVDDEASSAAAPAEQDSQQPSLETSPERTHSPASLWLRLAAYMADLAVVYLLGMATGVVAAIAGRPFPEKGVATYALGYFIFFAYMISSQCLTHTTVGKYIFGMEVRSEAAPLEFPGFRQILLRETVGRLLSSLFFGMGYWTAFSRPDRQAWSDQLAGTIVCRRSTQRRLARALAAFAVLSAIAVAGVFTMASGQKDRQRTLDALQVTAEQVENARKAVDQILESGADDAEIGTNLIPKLGDYERELKVMRNLLQGYIRDGLAISSKDREQTQTLLRALSLRQDVIEKLRGESELMRSYKPSMPTEPEYRARLRLLEGDIASLNAQADLLLKDAGLQ